MPEIILFCEDSFHEKFIGALVKRMSDESGAGVTPRFLSAQGGLSRMHAELKDFLRDLARDRHPLPDAVIVVVDANCEGYNGRKGMVDDVLAHYPQFQQLVSCAIPDPHIERWMLLDAKAFQTVFGRGCTLPSIKCAKDEYKKLLLSEIRANGIDPPLGGEEFAEDIVNAMDLGQAETREPSFGLFAKNLKKLFNGWRPR
jgi:hypothetical protein